MPVPPIVILSGREVSLLLVAVSVVEWPLMLLPFVKSLLIVVHVCREWLEKLFKPSRSMEVKQMVKIQAGLQPFSRCSVLCHKRCAATKSVTLHFPGERTAQTKGHPFRLPWDRIEEMVRATLSQSRLNGSYA
jgi:hypothetical protein